MHISYEYSVLKYKRNRFYACVLYILQWNTVPCGTPDRAFSSSDIVPFAAAINLSFQML